MSFLKNCLINFSEIFIYAQDLTHLANFDKINQAFFLNTAFRNI